MERDELDVEEVKFTGKKKGAKKGEKTDAGKMVTEETKALEGGGDVDLDYAGEIKFAGKKKGKKGKKESKGADVDEWEAKAAEEKAMEAVKDEKPDEGGAADDQGGDGKKKVKKGGKKELKGAQVLDDEVERENKVEDIVATEKKGKKGKKGGKGAYDDSDFFVDVEEKAAEVVNDDVEEIKFGGKKKGKKGKKDGKVHQEEATQELEDDEQSAGFAAAVQEKEEPQIAGGSNKKKTKKGAKGNATTAVFNEDVEALLKQMEEGEEGGGVVVEKSGKKGKKGGRAAAAYDDADFFVDEQEATEETAVANADVDDFEEIKFAGKKKGKKGKKESKVGQEDVEESLETGAREEKQEEEMEAQIGGGGGKKKGKKGGKKDKGATAHDDEVDELLKQIEGEKAVGGKGAVKEEAETTTAPGERKGKKGKNAAKGAYDDSDFMVDLEEYVSGSVSQPKSAAGSAGPPSTTSKSTIAKAAIAAAGATVTEGEREEPATESTAAAKGKKKKKGATAAQKEAEASVEMAAGGETKEEEKKEDSKKKKTVEKKVPLQVRQMQERLAKMQEMEEKRKRDEEERRRKEEEDDKKREEEERLKEERKRLKKEREKEKLKMKKQQGLVLTAKQKEEARRNALFREKLLQEAVDGAPIAVPEPVKRTKATYDNKKKKVLSGQQQQQQVVEMSATADAASERAGEQMRGMDGIVTKEEGVAEEEKREEDEDEDRAEAEVEEEEEQEEEEEEEDEDWDAKSLDALPALPGKNQFDEEVELPNAVTKAAAVSSSGINPGIKSGSSGVNGSTNAIKVDVSKGAAAALAGGAGKGGGVGASTPTGGPSAKSGAAGTKATTTASRTPPSRKPAPVESSDEDDSDEDEDESEEEEDDTAARRREARAKRDARFAEAMKNRSANDLRSPICCILGHVDTGKTKLLDKIRNTNVQEGEAGGITQQIGATYFPTEAIREKTKELKSDANLRVPGLLVIDTPGHESFTNLRSRGSGLCDIAILVIDIMHGLEQQTMESLNLLKMRKTPFVVALNKVDRMYAWKTCPNKPIRMAFKMQKQDVLSEFEMRSNQVMLELKEQGLNSALYYKNTDLRKNVSIVPTSAISGEGIPDLLLLLVQMTQKMMEERLMYISELQCTVLEVKVIEGLGTTIDVVLVNGVLREGDTIVVCGLQGPIVTNIRALLTPHPMKELRVKGSYIHHKEVKAAQGVKITAQHLDSAIAGTQLYVVGSDDDVDLIKEECMKDVASILSQVDKSGEGVCVQASTLGSLEALLEFLKTPDVNIPVSGISIGPVHKKDVMRAGVMLERKKKEYATILAFDVKVTPEAKDMAEEIGVKIFTADIIYHLFDQFTAYMANIREEKRKEAADDVVFPCELKILPTCVFNKKDPIVLGVEVVSGIVKIGTPLSVPSKEFIDIGRVASIEVNHKVVDTAKKGQSVAMKIVGQNAEESQKMYARHFDHTDLLVSRISRRSIDVLKENYKHEMTDEDWRLVVKLKRVFSIQ